MATVKISQLPPATGALSSTDVVAAVQSGTTVKATVGSFGYQPAGIGAVATTVQTKLREIVSVKDFGAVGDGVTNDGPAIQKAIDHASANKLQVNFEGLTYRILTFIELKSNIKLQGTSGTTIFVDKDCTLGDVIGGAARAVFTKNATSQITLDGIAFTSTKVGLTKSVTVCFLNVTDLYINNCKFNDFGNTTYYAQGFIMFGGKNIRVTNSEFNNNSGDGCALSFGSRNFYFENNEFSENRDWGLALVVDCNDGVVTNNIIKNNLSTGTGVDRCQNVIFSDNTISNNEHGVRVGEFAISAEKNAKITITNNTIANTAVAGVSVESMKAAYGEFIVNGNNISGSGNQGIRIVDAELGTIFGNTIYSCAAEGILFQAYDPDPARRTGFTTVIGNQINAVTWGIRQIASGGTLSSITVVGNQIVAASIGLFQLANNASYIDLNDSNYVSLWRALNFPSGITASTATAGGITPPANVQGYLPLYLSGTLYKIPFYNA